MADPRALRRPGALWPLVILLVTGLLPLTGRAAVPEPYRDAMREFVVRLAERARRSHPGFLVVAQNGFELLTRNGAPGGPPTSDYVRALDGQACEDLFYGYEGDDRPTPREATEWALGYLDLAKRLGLAVLVIDYCSMPAFVADSRQRAAEHGFVSYAAPDRGLDRIPPDVPTIRSLQNTSMLDDVRSFLYLINPHRYPERTSFLTALRAAPADLLVIDPFFEDGGSIDASDVEWLRTAPGGRRLVFAYLSIGEAETYRSYWVPSWTAAPPDWLAWENPDWPGNFLVRYWMPAWQTIVLEMLDDLVAAGFDGVYLDRVDAYEAFE